MTSLGPGMMAQMAGTMASSVAGSVIGHSIAHAMFGGSGSQQAAPAEVKYFVFLDDDEYFL